MKRKIRFTDFNGKVTETEIEIPDKSHLDAQIRFPSKVFKPKKGKGSFKRTKKIENFDN